ncbi:hypothetical protein D9M69_617740 [compost metagenome]
MFVRQLGARVDACRPLAHYPEGEILRDRRARQRAECRVHDGGGTGDDDPPQPEQPGSLQHMRGAHDIHPHASQGIAPNGGGQHGGGVHYVPNPILANQFAQSRPVGDVRPDDRQSGGIICDNRPDIRQQDVLALCEQLCGGQATDQAGSCDQDGHVFSSPSGRSGVMG